MKKTGKLMKVATLIILNMTLIMISCQKEAVMALPTGDMKDYEILSNTTDTLNCVCLINPSDTITQAEIDMLVYMREEEKLARDVYRAMYALYPLPVFNNISKSEQFHMDQVLCLLNYYGIADPASPDTGVFNNPDLQALYNTLVAQGSNSLIDALTVGATIEDLDIADLEEHLAETSNPAIILTFERLKCGSGHHIRAFSAWLTAKGVTYVPQYISQEEYDFIISSPAQFCGGIATTTNPVPAQ